MATESAWHGSRQAIGNGSGLAMLAGWRLSYQPLRAVWWLFASVVGAVLLVLLAVVGLLGW
jgi:hypothetical protein